MTSDFTHYLESRTTKSSSDAIIQRLVGKIMDPEGSRGDLIYISGPPATGKTVLAHMIRDAIPDLAQFANYDYSLSNPKKKIVFFDEIGDGGLQGEKVFDSLVESGYLVFILSCSEPRIPVDYSVRFDVIKDL